MNVPWWIPFAAGFEDGLNPCALMTCAVLILVSLWGRRRGFNWGKCAVFFVVPMFALNLVLNTGFLQNVLLTGAFQRAAVSAYFILAAVFAIIGGIFVYDWGAMLRHKDGTALLSDRLLGPSKTAGRLGGFWVLLVMAVAVAMSVTSSIWPANYFMTVIGNDIWSPGQFWATLGTLSIYTAVQLWLIVFFAVLCAWGRIALRLRQVMCAAVFLSAAGAVVYIF